MNEDEKELWKHAGMLVFGIIFVLIAYWMFLTSAYPRMLSKQYMQETIRSQTYWMTTMPIKIAEFEINRTNGNAAMRLQNMDASQANTITKLMIGNVSYVPNPPIMLAPGDSRILSFFGLPSGEKYARYEFPVVIDYVNSNGVALTQVGERNLVGQYRD